MTVFFVRWQLWEEMTFVLGCAIVIVFLISLFRLWWTNRQVRRQELLDEEKRARLTEMRRVGLSPTKKRHSDIPFGIRAIQSGVEVDGIWISRPTTPSRSSSKSKLRLSSTTTTTTTAQPPDAAPVTTAAGTRRSRSKYQPAPADDNSNANTATTNHGAGRPYSGSTLDGRSVSQRTPTGLPSSTETHGNLAGFNNGTAFDVFDTHSSVSTPLPQISEDGTVPVPSRQATSSPPAVRRADPLNEEALRHLEGHYTPASSSTGFGTLRGGAAPQLTTYIPSSRMSSPSNSIHRYTNTVHNHHSVTNGYYRPSKRGSTASADSASSSGGSTRSVSSNSSSTHSNATLRQPTAASSPMAPAAQDGAQQPQLGTRRSHDILSSLHAPPSPAHLAAAPPHDLPQPPPPPLPTMSPRERSSTTAKQPAVATRINAVAPVQNVHSDLQAGPAGPVKEARLSLNLSSHSTNGEDWEPDTTSDSRRHSHIAPLSPLARNKIRKSLIKSIAARQRA